MFKINISANPSHYKMLAALKALAAENSVVANMLRLGYFPRERLADVKIMGSMDESFDYESKEEAYAAVADKLETLLKKFGLEAWETTRIVVWEDEDKIESVNFRVADNGQLGVFANWASLPNITTEMWGVWSKLNALLTKEVA